MPDDVRHGHSAAAKVALGRTGKQVTRYGLGGFHQVEISSEIVEQVVDAYLGCGGNYIETARNYGGGASEIKIGRALQGRRDRVVLASKTAAASADDARRELDASLDALGTDHIDFYFFHGLDSADRLDRITAKGGAAEALIAARDQGIIDGLGMSSHSPEVYLDAFNRIDLSLILIWCNYLDNLNFPVIPERVIPEARRRGIGVTAMKPLADGFLYRSVDSAIAYCFGAGAEVAVCGTNTVEQVRQVARAVRNGPADEAARDAILTEAVELGRYVCRRCGDCPAELMEAFGLEGVFDRQMVDFLPHGPADYALRQRLAHWFGKRDEARAAFATMPVDPDKLIAAAEAVRCRYAIDVARKAKIALAKLTDRPANVI